jgi:hypothetical protein
MHRSRYPFTSDPSVLAARRGAAMAKSIAAVAVLGGLLAIAALGARDVQPRPGDRLIPPTAIHLPTHDVATSATVPAGELDPQLQLDPSEVADYRANVHG